MASQGEDFGQVVRRKAIDPADRELWVRFVRDIAPLPGHARPQDPVPPEPAAAAAAAPARPAPRLTPGGRPVAAPVVVGERSAGLDVRRWRALGSGRIRAERRLDLHGHTADAARAALERFLLRAAVEGVRCVEIITGRGSGETGGVIRRELPFWLDQPALRALVLAARHPHPANTGAILLLLRRARR